MQCTLQPLEGRVLLEACPGGAKQLASAAAAHCAPLVMQRQALYKGTYFLLHSVVSLAQKQLPKCIACQGVPMQAYTAGL